MIKELPERVWTRIAAGEVVERPASAVKELVENSLDAHASQVRVSLFDGGRQRIIVQDNGTGIAFDELPLALMYHATSKISEISDLENIMTLGYRGEALASIASVADVEIRSRERNSESGGLIRTHDGRISEHIEINCSVGTRIQVDNLFEALPARRKFLKSAAGELRRAAVFLREYAVCNPSIAFYLEHDNKEIFSTEGTGDKQRVLSKIWGEGAEIQNTIIQSGHLSLECWFQSKAGIASSRSDIIAFVNGRAVNDPVIKSAVTQGARELSGNWALFFTLEPSLVDVNIHPAKSEIRFRYPNEIYHAMKEAVNKLGSPMPEIFQEVQNIEIESPSPVPEIKIKTHEMTREPAMNNNYSRPEPVKPVIENIQREIFLDDFYTPQEPEINYLGQTSGGYLIYDNFDGIILMDPHAAHERVNYERIKALADSSNNMQKLLIPVLLHPTLALEAHEYSQELNNAGFELANTSQGIELRGVPALPEGEPEPESLLRASINALKNNHDPDTKNILWRTWATMACKASVKLTTKLTREEAISLWEKLHECKQPFVCPHGRPTMINITNQDLTKQFGRE
ncbi:MAG: ATP-binding protein [Synergistaceae bacterium]|nr:ATP-binding protein [Synergistaceae bacterium]